MDYLIFDGAMGSMLQGYGLKPGEPSETQNTANSEAVRHIHNLYAEAGADVLTANTFGAFELKYAGSSDSIIEAAMENLRLGAERAGRSVRAALDIGPTGRLLAPLGDLTFDEAYRNFKRAADCGAAFGADYILIETMTDIYEMKAAVLAAKTTGLPVIATMTFDMHGRSLTGTTPLGMVLLLEALQVDAIGMNCGYGPDLYEKLLPELLEAASLPVLVQPNAGLPEMVNGVAKYSLAPDEFAQSMTRMAAAGAFMLGGCCGTTPAHIAAIAKMKVCTSANGSTAVFPEKFNRTLKITGISSPSKTLLLDKPMEAYTIAKCSGTDIDTRIDEAMELADDADIIEIHIDTPADVQKVQEMVRVPLSLKADSPEVLLEAVRLYNGCPLITGVPQDEGLINRLRAFGGVIKAEMV